MLLLLLHVGCAHLLHIEGVCVPPAGGPDEAAAYIGHTTGLPKPHMRSSDAKTLYTTIKQYVLNPKVTYICIVMSCAKNQAQTKPDRFFFKFAEFIEI